MKTLIVQTFQSHKISLIANNTSYTLLFEILCLYNALKIAIMLQKHQQNNFRVLSGNNVIFACTSYKGVIPSGNTLCPTLQVL